jgi:hypothetical protein
MPRYIVELLGNVLAEVAKRATALRTARVLGLMYNVFAVEMLRKRLASRRLAGLRARPCWCVDRCRAIVGLQIFETQFQLLDLERPVGECLPEHRYSVTQIRELAFVLT